ncbi:hypothetical protein AVEN_165148-1 [Araneus ventricosus]|uniref:Uncharacterized protein n=1 Tax=Araneus ventricosus TaxID=182803 RepID=A0A4Y2B590_ARAVE|nr:hypothetical protein AVEN_165148-1 [Araneus ventricosus]
MTVEKNDYYVLQHSCAIHILSFCLIIPPKSDQNSRWKKQKIQIFTRPLDLLGDRPKTDGKLRHLIHLSPCRLFCQMGCKLLAKWTTTENDVGHSVDLTVNQTSNSDANRLA